MQCPNCKQKKQHQDFYWRKDFPTVLVYHKCKDCVIEKVKERNRAKAISKKDFLSQYFN